MASASSLHFVAGLSSGVFSAVLLQPVDLLKTRVQQSGHKSLTESIREIRQAPNVIASLWRGTVPSAMRTGFGSALYFTSLNYIRQQASSRTRPMEGTISRNHSSSLPVLSNITNMVSGIVARCTAGFILMPLTVIKVRYESNLYNYRSILEAGRHIFWKEGLRGFFSGVGATTMRDAPNAGLYVLFYEQFKKQLSHLRQNIQSSSTVENDRASRPGPFYYSSPSINFVSGMLAGMSCSVVSNPFDAVKTRIQLQPKVYRNMWQAVAKIVREEGGRALWDGLALRMCRKALSSALAWTMYEELVKGAIIALNHGNDREN